MVYAFSPRTWGAKASGSLSLRPAYKVNFRTTRATVWPCLKKLTYFYLCVRVYLCVCARASMYVVPAEAKWECWIPAEWAAWQWDWASLQEQLYCNCCSRSSKPNSYCLREFSCVSTVWKTPTGLVDHLHPQRSGRSWDPHPSSQLPSICCIPWYLNYLRPPSLQNI